MRHITITNLAGCEHAHVTVAGQPAADVVEEARAAFAQALDLLASVGARREHLVRSRLFARDAAGRRAASDVRLSVLAGDLRAASSSYIDDARIPPQANVVVDLVARLGQPAGPKSVREYEPRIAPPMFVALDGVVHLSGVTDINDGFDTQLTNIRANVDASLAAAGATFANVTHIAAHVSRKVALLDAWRAITTRFAAPGATFTLSHVDGYSAPEKLVEIETTARL